MKYWVYIDNEIKGPFEKEELLKLPGFNSSTLICPQSPVEEETKEWKEAGSFPEFFLSDDSSSASQSQTEQRSDMPEALSLNIATNDIIIERFDANNLFVPVHGEISQASSPMDPLSLSQIRKKEENILQNLEVPTNPEIEEKKENEKKVEEISSKDEVEMDKKNETVFERTEDKTTIEIPDTESLLNSIDVISSQYSEFKSDVKEFNSNVDEFKTSGTEFSMKNEAEKIVKQEKIVETGQGSDKSFSDFLPYIENIKKEILNIIDLKISEFERKFLQPANDVERIKNELINYVDSKFAELPISNSSDIVNHLDIEVKDLRVKLESIEKKLDKAPEVVLLSPETTDLPKDSKIKVEDPSKTVVIKKDEEVKEKKSLNLKPLLRIIVGIILFILAIGSISFALKQFGIFDITKYISKEKGINMNIKYPADSVDNIKEKEIETSTFTSNQFLVEIDTTNKISDTSVVNEEVEKVKTEKNDSENIIFEIKNYKLNSDKTLEQTIVEIIKMRKGDVKNIIWELDGNEVNIKSRIPNRELIFKFEYDFQSEPKILKPLNTIAINTLKAMMEEKQSKKKSTIRKKTQLKQIKKEDERSKTVEQTKEKEENFNSSQENVDEGGDEYLIIEE